MLRSTTSGATERPIRRLLVAFLGLALIVEVVTAAGLLSRRAAPPPTDPLRARVAAEMPEAVAAVSAFWGDDWPHDVVVVTTGTDAEFAEKTGQPTRNWTGIAAVTASQRIVFAPGANSMTTGALRIVLRHELFHYAARADTALDAPRWLTEGVADFVARPPGPRPGMAAVPVRLPSDAELDAGGIPASAAYDRAWWFARFVADEYGAPGLRRLYQHNGDPRAALGVGWVDLLTRWQRWLAG